MTVEEGIAQTIEDNVFLSPWDTERDRMVSAIVTAIAPLLNRVRAEGAVQTLRALSDKYAGFTSDNPIQQLQFASVAAFMAEEAQAIEQNSEGNET